MKKYLLSVVMLLSIQTTFFFPQKSHAVVVGIYERNIVKVVIGAILASSGPTLGNMIYRLEMESVDNKVGWNNTLAENLAFATFVASLVAPGLGSSIISGAGIYLNSNEPMPFQFPSLETVLNTVLLPKGEPLLSEEEQDAYKQVKPLLDAFAEDCYEVLKGRDPSEAEKMSHQMWLERREMPFSIPGAKSAILKVSQLINSELEALPTSK